MIGNVWEWTPTGVAEHAADEPKAAAFRKSARRPEAASYDPQLPEIKIPRKVIKGGSHLCAPNYCRRYRPAARHAEPVDTSTSHVGFRCIIRKKERETDREGGSRVPMPAKDAGCDTTTFPDSAGTRFDRLEC